MKPIWSCLLLIATVLLARPARAVVARAPDAPQPQLGAAAPPPPGTAPPMATEIGKDGSCVATTDVFSPSDYVGAESAARLACMNTLLPKRPIPLVQTPGSFFAGYAWGTKSKQWIYGPQVGVGLAVLLPLHRPTLALRSVSAGAGGSVPTGSQFTFALPDAMSWASALAVSFAADLGSFAFPGVSAGPPAQPSFNLGLYVAPQFGWEWWDQGAKSVMFSIGVLAGYIDTGETGPALAVGVQPALVAQF